MAFLEFELLNNRISKDGYVVEYNINSDLNLSNYRIQRTVKNLTTFYIFNNNELIFEVDSNGIILSKELELCRFQVCSWRDSEGNEYSLSPDDKFLKNGEPVGAFKYAGGLRDWFTKLINERVISTVEQKLIFEFEPKYLSVGLALAILFYRYAKKDFESVS